MKKLSKLFPFRFPFFLDEEEWELEKEPSGLSISEDEKNFYVEAALPGMKLDEIEITLDNDILRIKGEKKEEDKSKKYYRKASSSFYYKVILPGPINKSKEPEATYENGIMKIVFPKASEYKPKKITIKKS